MFRKRQNLYYVKVQERLSTLDAGSDYIMTVTTLCGPSKTSEDVTIHNKFYYEPEEPDSLVESCSLPFLQSLDMTETREKTGSSGFDERRSIDSILDTPIR